MKTLIAYSSRNGSTKKIANKIKEYDDEFQIYDIKSDLKVNIDDYNLLFVGGYIDKGTYNLDTLNFVKEIKNKNICIFFTLGAYPTSKHAYFCLKNIIELFESNGNRVINHFHCQGAIDDKLTEWMKTLSKDHSHSVDEIREQRWEDAKKHPNQEDFNSLKSFVSQSIKIYENLILN